jgi:hypothetical protein
MKKIYAFARNILITSIFLTSINQVIFAGPYAAFCINFNCQYFHAATRYGLCTDGTKDLYATAPDAFIPCYGTRQWYGYIFGWHSHGTMMHQGWYTTAIEGATGNIYTVNQKGKFWCSVDCGSGASNTDTIEFFYDSAEPVINSQPQNQVICEGASVNFSITAFASYISYQWEKMLPGGSFVGISGANSNTFSYIPPVGDDMSKFRCNVSNGCGGSYSDEATLDITSPPIITTNPTNVIICQEGSTSFSISAGGDIGSYSWEYSTNNVNYSTVPTQAPFSGTGTSQLTLTNTGLGYNNYYFRCRVANNCFTRYSSGAKLTVETRLTVNSAPSGNYYVCDGSNASFSVSYSGTSPITVQWQEYINGWIDITGQTSSSLTFPVSLSMNNRQYHAVITQTNACNTTIQSTAGTLLVNALPKIETQPQSQEKCRGENATFSVMGSGTGVNYQWQISRNSGVKWSNLINGGHYSGVLTANLLVSNIQDSINSYQFRCTVAGTCPPSVTSNAASLIVDVPPLINQVDQNQVKCIGQSVTINSFASGTAPLSYKWRKDGVSITDWTNLSYYSIPAVGTLDAGKYDYLVKNICNATGIESDDVTLTVNTPPSVNIHPAPVTICEGSQPTVKFTVSVTGGTSLQWQVNEGQGYINLTNNATYSGVTSNELTISNPSSYMDQYQFRCQVIGSCDPPITSNSALLTIKTIPEIFVQPENDTVCFGASATFSVTASSNIPMEYKWKQGGQAITGWLSINTLVIDDVTLDNDDNYQVMVRNECAYNTPVNSELAYLKVIPPPNVSLGADRHLCPGNSIELDPGMDYVLYSWSTGATTRSIEVTEQGNYTLNVTDINGCTNSDKVYIYLDPSIPVLDLGSDGRYCLGEAVSLDATDLYDSYLWKKTSNPDQTISTNRLIQVTETDSYVAIVSKLTSVCTETDTVHIIIAKPYDKEQICIVTVDSSTQKNLIVWEKTPDAGIAYYHIYREGSLIGTSTFNELSVFVDNEVSPRRRSYLYKISVIDTCGNESWLSPYHKPLFLQYVSSVNGVNLTWSKYEVEDGTIDFTSYKVYRGTDSTVLSPIEENIPPEISNFTDDDPLALKTRYYYKVAGVKTLVCDPANLLGKKADSGPYSHSMSNIEDNRFQVGIYNMKSVGELAIFPNPSADFTTVSFPNPEQNKFQLIVRDLSGKMVLIMNNITQDKVTIESSRLKAGYYSVEVVGNNIYRGKFIIE